MRFFFLVCALVLLGFPVSCCGGPGLKADTALPATVDAGATTREGSDASDSPKSIFEAAKMGSVPDLKDFLAAGVSGNAQDFRWKMTPLIYAAIHGRVDACRFLLENGASVELKDRKGWDAEDYVRMRIRNAESEEAAQPAREILALLEAAKETIDASADGEPASSSSGALPLRS